MPLGKQFRNTYHIDEQGQQQFHTDAATTPAAKADLKQGLLMPYDKHVAAPRTSSTPEAGVAYQGMLYSPHTATGHKDDPLIPHEVRKAVFHKALHTDDLEAYTKTATTELGKSYTPSPKQARAGAELINQTAFESGIPTHTAEKIDAKAVLYPKQKRSNGGHFNPINRSIVLHKETPVSYTRTPDTEVRASTKGAPIPNPKYSSMIKSHDFDDDWYGRADLAHHGTFFDDKGTEIPKHKLAIEDYDIHQGNPLDPKNLPEGHSANVYPGKGQNTDKYIATPFQVERGTDRRSRYGGEYINRWYHTRHERIPTEGTEKIRGKVVRKLGTPSISSDALVHEIGHSEDPHVRDRLSYQNPDPVKEGTADGYSDRFDRHKDNYEEAVAPSPRRAKEIQKKGYGVDEFSSKLHKALYAAVRQHVSMGDTHAQDIMSRSQAFEKAGNTLPRFNGAASAEQKSNGSKLLLGHLYSTHAHVRDILGHLNLSDVGESAAAHYRSQVTDAGRGPQYEQGHLFE
jgi:hypothetical protein